MNKNKGFTLIELVVVIVILGILAATALPRFINLQEDADRATFQGIAGAFKSGVNLVHMKWRVAGNNQAQQNFIEINDPLAGGDLSVNSNGFPADTRGVSLTLNSQDDCLDVWRAVLDSDSALVNSNTTDDFQATYNGSNDCTYTYVKQPALTVDYDSNSGEIVISD